MLKFFIFIGLSLLVQADPIRIAEKENIEKELIILHTNDLHSSLQGSAPEKNYSPNTTGDDLTLGGFARIAAIIKQEKQENANVLALDGGDFLMGTLFQSLEMETGFQLKLMHDMGYDALCIGNHEFDFGVKQLYNYINHTKADNCPALLLANLNAKGKTKEEQYFSQLFKEKRIKPYHIITTQDLRVGIIGLLGDEAYEVANAHQLKLKRKIKIAQTLVKHLRKKENVDIVIALSHSGIWFDSNKNVRAIEDVELAQKVDGLDIIISGHTHSVLSEPLYINDTYIVQAGDHGKKIGKLKLSIGAKPKLKSYKLIDVDDRILGDTLIQKKIDKQKEQLSKQTLSQFPYHYDSALFHLDFPLNYKQNIKQCNIGNFIADAMHYYVNQHVKDHTNIAIISHGMIRSTIPKGKIYLPEVFNAVSLGTGNDGIPGYPLSQIYLEAKEIKRLMQLLIKASHHSSNYYLFSSGLQIDYSRKNKNFNRIEDIRIKNASGSYKSISKSHKNQELFSIVADAYTISFLSLIKKKSFGFINIEPKNIHGEVIAHIEESIIDINPQQEGIQEAKTWVSIIEYAQSFKADNEQLPHIPYQYEEQDLRLQAIN